MNDLIGVRRTIGPLRAVFWGAFLCVVDVTVRSGGSNFDLLNDVLGKILITLGVFRLWTIPVTRSYGKGMGLVVLVSVVSTLKTAARQWGGWNSDSLEPFATAWEFAELAAILLFCTSMRLLCRRTGLERPERSWKTTTFLFLVFFALPVGAVHALALLRQLEGKTGSINVGSWAILAMLVILLPVFHFFISTSRMKRAAQAAG